MKCEKLFEAIDSLYEKYVSVWEKAGNIESPTEYKEGLDKLGEYFVSMAKEKGWKTEVYKQEKAGNAVCITMNPDASEKPISLSGHLDTVHPLGSFGNPAVRLDGTNIYGPGVMDCKGGVVAAFMAMDALDRCGFKNRPVQLLLQTDEECNSMLSDKKTISFICERAKGSVAFLNCESSRVGTLVLERKGIIRFSFDVRGKAIHSSRCKEGASAVCDAAYRIIELEKLKDEDGITCNCGIVNGGTAPNTVAEACSFVADIRFSTAKELEWVKEFVKEISEKTFIEGCTCNTAEIGFRPAMELTDANLKLLATMNEIYAENGLPTLKARKSLGGSDAAEITCEGIPCVDSIGVEGDYIHSTREYATIRSLCDAAKRIAAVVYEI